MPAATPPSYSRWCERQSKPAPPRGAIEQRIDFSKYVEKDFGISDCVVIADGTLHIVDYKHSQDVLMKAEDNSQMKLYALDTLELFDSIHDINRVSMNI